MKQWVPRVIGRAIVMAAGLVIAITGPAHAVAIGDHFTVIFTETLPTPGLVATADITLGPPTGSFFSISSLTAISGGVCLTCGLTSQDLTGAYFDSATSGLTGHVLGTFIGEGGASHSFALVLADLPGATWFLTDIIEESSADFAQGTYRTVASVPEPSTLLLLGSALAALTAWRRGIKDNSC